MLLYYARPVLLIYSAHSMTPEFALCPIVFIMSGYSKSSIEMPSARLGLWMIAPS